MSDPHHTPDYEPPIGRPVHEPHDYRGLIALVLAVAVGLTLVIAIGGGAWAGRSLGDAGSEALIALGGAIVGALAAYIAGKALNGH